jgi:hypothetical protein
MLSPYAQKEIARQRTAAKFPFLIEITHPVYETMRYANSSQNISYQGNIYYAASFAINPPDRDGSKIGNATLSISAIDQFWIEKIRETQEPAELRFIAVIVYDEGFISGVEPLEENKFTLRAVNWNETVITWTMVFDETMSLVVPSETCNAQTCPGCA